MDLDLQQTPDGITLRIRVIPRARKSELGGVESGVLVVRICAPPVEGKANKALRDFLAKTFNLRKSQVEIKSGEKSRHKIIVLTGAQADRIRARAHGEE